MLGTIGDNSPVISVDLGANSSLNLSGQRSVFSTLGNDSHVFDLAHGAQSDVLIFLEHATVASEGSDANAVTLSYGGVANVIALNTVFSALGDRSAGIVVNGTGTIAGATILDVFLGSVLIETADGPAVLVGAAGTVNRTNVTITDSTLTSNGGGVGTVALTNADTLVADQNSLLSLTIRDTDIFLNGPGAAVLQEGLGRRSGSLSQIFGGTITTIGNDASGVVIGVNRSQDFSGSNQSVTLENTIVSTSGDNANAVVIHEAEGENSDYATAIRDPRIRTTGENSAGLSFIPGEHAIR
jgi:hypothetical protein